MFSLIVTIISIALVAALALATIYYGGTAFNRNSTEIKAAEIMLQQQQIRAAMSLYKVDHEGLAPPDLNALVDGHYLKQVPTYLADNSSLTPAPSALASDPIEWLMPAQYIGTFVLAQNVSDNVCAEVNFKARGVRGIPNQLYTSQLPVQCFYSSDKSTNIVIVTDDSATVSNALTGTNITPTQPANPFTLPTSEINTTDNVLPLTDSSKWKLAPSGSSGSSDGGTTTDPGSSTGAPEVAVVCADSNCEFGSKADSEFTRAYRVTVSNVPVNASAIDLKMRPYIADMTQYTLKTVFVQSVTGSYGAPQVSYDSSNGWSIAGTAQLSGKNLEVIAYVTWAKTQASPASFTPKGQVPASIAFGLGVDPFDPYTVNNQAVPGADSNFDNNEVTGFLH